MSTTLSDKDRIHIRTLLRTHVRRALVEWGTRASASEIIISMWILESADDNQPCEENGRFVSDPETCTSFYQCKDGIKFEAESCPEGTLFDHSSQSCIWAESVPVNSIFKVLKLPSVIDIIDNVWPYTGVEFYFKLYFSVVAISTRTWLLQDNTTKSIQHVFGNVNWIMIRWSMLTRIQ